MPSDDQIDQMIIENDTDGDELIDFEEFVQMADKYRRIETTNPEVGLADAFR